MADIHGRTQVLVVDDERLIRMTLAARLRSIGYDVYCAATVEEAVTKIKEVGVQCFRAIITDIYMGEMDGFVFRDVLRGMDATLPIFFLTALDPEEGGGFLQRILEDANSYYLPKSVKTDVLLNRIKSIVASRRIEQFIERQVSEQKKAIELAANVQRSLMPTRALITERGFYTFMWRPKDVVSGDLFEAINYRFGTYIYILGDIQGHGTSAALAMTAVQSFLKRFPHSPSSANIEPEEIANMLHEFFRANLADVSYMTALICVHTPLEDEVRWLSCGAPDLVVLDPENPSLGNINPQKCGALPIGLLPDTVYTAQDVVTTKVSKSAVCLAYTDGILDLARDKDALEQMDDSRRRRIMHELILDACKDASMVSAPYKFVCAANGLGYDKYADDVSVLIFGAATSRDKVFLASVPMVAGEIDRIAQTIEKWCEEKGWGSELATKVQLVFEEKLMNLHDHGFPDRERIREVACVRLRKTGNIAELTVWDCGSPEPSIEVAGGDSDVAFELANRSFSGRGRGRLMVREICDGIKRSKYDELNETVYRIPFGSV